MIFELGRFIGMPTPLAETAHIAGQLLSYFAGEHRPKAIPPETNDLMANVDAALKQRIIDVPHRQRKPHIHEHDEADDLG